MRLENNYHLTLLNLLIFPLKKIKRKGGGKSEHERNEKLYHSIHCRV